MKQTLKKSICIILTALMLLTAAPLAGFAVPDIGISAQAAENGYFTYSVSNGEATITDVDTAISGEITIPSTLDGYPVTTISRSAFYNCESLTNITIPDSVTDIDSYAFYSCESLVSISLPDSLTTIGNSAFEDCESLVSVTIPDSVTSIGNSVFNGCTSLEKIIVDKDNESYSSDANGVLFNKDKTLLIQYPCASKSTTYTVPDSVTKMESYAFAACKNLERVSFGAGSQLTSISPYAFNCCYGLTSIAIPDSVTFIDYGAFEDCVDLTSVTFGADSKLETIDYDAFYSCESLVSISLPDSLTTIGSEAFSCCMSLADITIPDSVTSIGREAFFGCENLVRVTFGANSKLTTIGYYAFAYCMSLADITIPDSVTSIGSEAFSDCENLVRVTFEKNSKLKTIGYGAFYGCINLADITIPSGVTKIDGSTFYGCESLTDITIPDSVTSIGSGAFYTTGYYNDESNWVDGVLYIDNCLIEAKEDISGTYAVREGTVLIAEMAFYETGLTGVTIPDSVKTIGYGAFYGCINLADITIPSGVTKIDGSTFYGCESLTDITIPDSVTSVGSGAFYTTGYYNDESNWVDGVLYIDNCLIEAKEDISGTYVIREDTAVIADYAFSGCYNLENVTLPDSLTTIGSDAFYYCRSLADITIPDSVTEIAYGAFSGCSSLATIAVPDSVTSIGGKAFEYTAYYNDESNWDESGLYVGKHLLIGMPDENGCYEVKDGIKTIAGGAFWFCEDLVSIAIPDSVTGIGEDAFFGCDNLSDVYYAGSEAQWNNIDVNNNNNDCLLNATIHFGRQEDTDFIDTENVFVAESGRVVGLAGTAAQTLLAQAGADAKAVDRNGKVLSGTDKIGTGAVLTLADGTEFEIVVPGDIDGEGIISSSDARTALRNAVGLDSLTDAQQKAADVNGDGVVNSADARDILRAAVGLEDSGDWLKNY